MLHNILVPVFAHFVRGYAFFVQACLLATSLTGLNQTLGHLLAVVSRAHFLVSSRRVVPKRKTSINFVSNQLNALMTMVNGIGFPCFRFEPRLIALIVFRYTPVHLAAMHGHLEVVKLLLDNTEDSSAIEAVDFDGSSALALAVAHGHRDLAKLLVEYGAGLDSADKHGMTPIFLAVKIIFLLSRVAFKPHLNNLYGND